MKMRNFVREKIAANGYALGAFIASGSSTNCEILGLIGVHRPYVPGRGDVRDSSACSGI